MKKLLTLLLTAVLAVLVMLLSSMGQAQSADPTPLSRFDEMSTRSVHGMETWDANSAKATWWVEHTMTVHASLLGQRGTAEAQMQLVVQGTPFDHWTGCSDGNYRDSAHEADCDWYRTAVPQESREHFPCEYDSPYLKGNMVCLGLGYGPDGWPTASWPDPPLTPTPGGPAEPGGPIATPGPGGPTGPVHTVGEGLFDVDAGATALHQMVHSPAATPAFRSICDLSARDPADIVACDLYKAAYRLRHGNPCRHNDEGEAVCLH